MTPFGERMLKAFGNIPKGRIADILGVKPSAITNYLNNRVPDDEKLILISDFTNCSIHWLITGKGSQFVSAEQSGSISIREDLLTKLRTIAAEQSHTVFADAELAANVDEKTLDLLVNFLLHRSLVSFNLIASGDIISARDLKRAERFTFVSNIPQSLDDRVKELVRQELSRRTPDLPANQELALGADVGGEVGPLVPLSSADFMVVPDRGTVDGGEERLIDHLDIEELERRLRSRKRKVG